MVVVFVLSGVLKCSFVRLSVVVVADVVVGGVVVAVTCDRRGVDDDTGCPPFSSLFKTMHNTTR